MAGLPVISGKDLLKLLEEYCPPVENPARHGTHGQRGGLWFTI